MQVVTLRIEIEDQDGDWDESYDNMTLQERWQTYLTSVFEDEPVIIRSVELVSQGDV